jgi:outer membrane protein assembly factor BamA
MNMSHRWNWIVGAQQQPYYGYGAAGTIPGANDNEGIYVQQYQRYIYRSIFGALIYPMSRFRRVEFGLEGVNVHTDLLEYYQPYDLTTGYPTDVVRTRSKTLDNSYYTMPSVSLVFDNSLFGFVGPFMGRRSRIELAQSLGSWTFTQATFDYRRYDRLGPITLASRIYYFGRRGPDADRFSPMYIGSTELVRGHTYGSYERTECTTLDAFGSCEVNNLIGTQVAAGNIELRFPLLDAALARAIPLPGIEGAAFYDIGLAWNTNSVVKWNREPGDPYIDLVRYGFGTMRDVHTPVRAWGFGIRGNLLGFLILRLDYAIPINRPGLGHLWTLSLGPTF